MKKPSKTFWYATALFIYVFFEAVDGENNTAAFLTVIGYVIALDFLSRAENLAQRYLDNKEAHTSRLDRMEAEVEEIHKRIHLIAERLRVPS